MDNCIKNYISFDIEDWFQVENFKILINKESWGRYELRVRNNTAKILEILSNHKVKATFFILGWIAKKCPMLVKEIVECGHEIASHGFWHELIYNQTEKEFSEDIYQSKSILEDISGKKVIGYRAPSFSITKDSIWALDVLYKHGFLYDSSIFPTSFHDRYGFSNVENNIFKIKPELYEIPISTYRFAYWNLPVGGGGYFRLFPYKFFKSLLTRINKKGERFVFYLHPWELDYNQPRIDVPFYYRFRHYINLHKTEQRLEYLLKDFKFQPLCEGINNFNK